MPRFRGLTLVFSRICLYNLDTFVLRMRVLWRNEKRMPINFQQIYARIREIAAGADESKRTLEEKRDLARRLLSTYASELDYLQQKVEAAKAVDSNIRCAVPLNEPLTATYPPPAPAADVTVIAADGSQINPDRHASIQFSIINVGIIIMKLHSGQAPEICVETEMLYGDDLISNGNPISDGMVAMRRDISERLKLDEISKGYQGTGGQPHRRDHRIMGSQRR